MTHDYTDEHIQSLDWREHIRLRPGMYIGRTGDGSAYDDGIYLLLKEVIDNAVDEYIMGAGKRIELEYDERTATVRDYGRGIPLASLLDCVARINTGGKYDGGAFKKSVGLNGVGSKVVNALSERFEVASTRSGQRRRLIFQRGLLREDHNETSTEPDGTMVRFTPDPELFVGYAFQAEHVEHQLKLYAYLNTGLTLRCNGVDHRSSGGLLDLVNDRAEEAFCYPPVHLLGQDLELVLTHGNQYGDQYYTFVNGQCTVQGGTHLAALREGLIKTIREFYKKDFDAADIRAALVAAISVRIEDPVFESQTKTKLGSVLRSPQGPSLRGWIVDFVKQELDNYLRRNAKTAEALLQRLQRSERERKEIAGIKKLATERARKANIHNRKLRDCRIRLDSKDRRRLESTLFITEGDSASGSITKSRDPELQAVFSLKGKPLNCFGLTRKVVYQNEELNLLQHALDIEDSLENLRYNHIVLATDADVDGMHIRLLLLTFFIQFFPELLRRGHLAILQTPLFRVRNRQRTIYCYDEAEKQRALGELKGSPEVTRFKGLGEISPEEFKHFIGPAMRLDPVRMPQDRSMSSILRYYMGKNTPERQDFIIENLRVEETP